MKLAIRPDKINHYEKAGVIIRGSSPAVWFHELSVLKLKPVDVRLYPLPGMIANTIWGCLVEFDTTEYKLQDAGKNDFAYCAHGVLFIPALTSVFPQVHASELSTLLRGKKHLIHPETGLVELPEPVNPVDLLASPVESPFALAVPAAPEFIPKQAKSFMVKPLPPEEAIKEMIAETFPDSEKLKDEPLSGKEKAKLWMYRKLFSKEKDPKTGKSEIKPKPLLGFLDKIRTMFGGDKDGKWTENMEQDYDELEKRNQEAMDRLIDMLKNNPEEALKYAIPIDENGSTRGGNLGTFELTQRWNNYSLYGNSGRGGSGSIISNRTNDLAAEYNRIAQDLVNKKEYKKAAFIYHKLLKNHYMAAETLEKGEMYPEAAALFLEYVKNKERAAMCYEKGRMTMNAIDLYKELNKHEKVGDLYIDLNKRKDADVYYEKTVDEYKVKNQYVKASLIYREKMLRPQAGQQMLIEGWRENQDAVNCMGLYFSNVENDDQRRHEYEQFYSHEVDENNRVRFLYVVKHEFQKHPNHAERLKTMAYETVVKEIPKNPRIVAELQDFNKDDKQFANDTLRFRNFRNWKDGS